MYKDLDKQREAVRLAVRKHRAKGITKVLPEKVIPVIPEKVSVIPEVVIKGAVATMSSPRPEHSPTCKCILCSLKR
jgi:hypothetical protein